MDEHGIIEVVNIYYELYFITDKKKKSYFLIIKENAFFHTNPENEIVYFEATKYKNNLFWFFNRAKIV